MGEVTLTEVKYLSPVGVSDPLSLAFWADFVDPDYLREFAPIFTAVAVFCGIWYFIMPYIHRFFEKKVQRDFEEKYPETPHVVVELGLVWPFIGVLGVLIALGFALTANSRICMLCASNPDNVRGFGGGFCAYTTELADSLRADNTTNCIFVKESILGPGRRTWMKMSSRDQLSVTSEQLERKFTGTKGVHTLWIKAENSSDAEVVTLLHLEQNDTAPLTPFNETLDAIGVFAESQSEPVDFAGSLGWGNGKLFMRASRETVQLIVFRQDEMVCAFFGAMGIAILISVPWMETCDFTRHLDVNRERYFLAPMSWMTPTNTGLARLDKVAYAFMNYARAKDSWGWLTLKVRASRSGNTTMDVPLREISREDGEAEVLRIQQFMFQYWPTLDVELTEEERKACEDSEIVPPPEPEVVEEEPDPRSRRGRGRREAR